MDNNNNNELQNMQETQNSQENQQVSLGKKGVGIILLILLFILIIICFLFRSCSVVKTGTNDSENAVTSESTNLSSAEGNDIYAENGSKSSSINSENSSVYEGSTSSIVDDITTGKNEFTITELDKDKLAFYDYTTKDGVVAGRKALLLGSDYLYRVDIIIKMESEDDLYVRYYCPKKTWDALKTDDNLEVTYQKDQSGNISIYSISKATSEAY